MHAGTNPDDNPSINATIHHTPCSYLEDEVGPLSQQYMEKFDLIGNKELDLGSFIKLYGSLKASEGHRLDK